MSAADAARIHAPSLSRDEAEAYLVREARLLDRLQLEEWNALFTAEGIYWVPLDEHAPVQTNASIVRDTPLRREERVHHLLHNRFPAQWPRSRTLHYITNVEVEVRGEEAVVVSNQLVYEMRTGDHKQIGLGEPRSLAAEVEHRLRWQDGRWKIDLKKVLLINRDSWMGNLTFLL